MEGPKGSGDCRLLSEERLRTDREYREVVRAGARCVTAHFVVYRDFPGGSARKIGISVGKRAGRAVVRNRIKRVLREFYRFHKCVFPGGSRTAIVVRKAPSRTGLAQVSEELLPAILRRWGRKEGVSPCGPEISSSVP